MILSNEQIFARRGDSIIIEPFNPDNVNTSSYDVTLGEWYFIEHRPRWWRRMFALPTIYNIWDIDHVRRVWGKPQQALPAWQVLPTGRAHQDHDTSWIPVWRKLWKGIGLNDRVILIPPKHTILAHTQEFIGGRCGIVVRRLTSVDEGRHWPPTTTMMKARSSFGRNFIEVCKCAGYGDVGYTNRWTMEITNNSRFYSIPLVVGRRIAQIVFMETGNLKEGLGDYAASGKYQATGNIDQLMAAWTPYAMLPRLNNDRDIGEEAA